MNRYLFSRIRRSGDGASPVNGGDELRGISRATRVGLLIGGAVVIAGSAVPAIAANTTAKPASSASSAKSAAATGTHTKVKPVPGAKPSVRALAPILASPASASLPDSTCTVSGTTRTCDLYALAGTISVPGIAAPLPIWGFSLNAAGPATLPGPTLVAMEGETLNVTLHNSLPAGGGNLALEIPESTAAPDLGGIAEGQTSATPYVFTGLTPGTYIYEAGATTNAQRQVAMGLAGMVVVRPKNWSATCHNAYDESLAGLCDGVSFNAESPVQLNELSTAFNTATAANPTGSDLHHYTPDVFLVNGQSFNSASPTTGSIPVNAGDRVLLRYADLGLRERSISIGSGVFDPLAVSSTSMPTGGQRELASDSKLLTVHPDLAAIYLNPVQTADTLTRVDPGLAPNTMVPLYDQGQHLNHWTGLAGQEQPTEGGGIGGMIAMLQVLNGPVGTPAGPKTVINVTPKVNDLNPAPSAGDDVTVAATVTSTTGSPITGAEWFLDSPSATANPVTSAGCPAGSTANFCFTIPEATMQSMLAATPPVNGVHVIWLHAQDVNGWGVAAGDTFSVDVSGPIISSTSLHSSPTNGNRVNDLDGSTNLDIVGSASASLSGWVVTAAEACVDAPCQTTFQQNTAFDQGTMSYGPFAATSFGLNIVAAGSGGTNDPNGAIVGINGAIPFASLPSTADGAHTFYIHACEAPVPPNPAVAVTAGNCGRWGDTTETILAAPFVIDTASPATTSLVVSPDPNNGFTSAPGNVAYLNEARVTATFNDGATGGSPISMAEVFMAQPGVLPWCYTAPLSPPLNPCPSSAPAGFSGTGAEMVPVGGKWNQLDTNKFLPDGVTPNPNFGKGAPQTADAFIPLIDVHAFPEGHVWFWVHAMDQAGNWGSFSLANGCDNNNPATNCHVLTLDKTPPILDSATATKHATTTDLIINAHDPLSNGVQTNIVRAEYFFSPCLGVSELETCLNDPGPGNGTPIAVPTPAPTVTVTATINNPPNGQALYIRVMDAAGNWSVVNFKNSVTTYP